MTRMILIFWSGLSAMGAAWGCASTSAEKSTGTNWLECEEDADCTRVVPGSRCGEDQFCVDSDGNRIPANRVALEGGAGGASPETDGSTDAGTGGGSSASGGAPGLADSGPPIQDADAAAGHDCYSPGQNLDLAYEPGAIGCKCIDGSPGVCIGHAALLCADGRWQAVQDGPCGRCWTPEEPDLANTHPDQGCACDEEGTTECVYSQFTGYLNAECVDGKWTASENPVPCDGCTSDRQCRVGHACVDGACQRSGTICEVDSVQYAQGTTNIPSPDCLTCECTSAGLGNCSGLEIPCAPEPPCAEGWQRGSVCLECGVADSCVHTKSGCLEPCFDCGFGAMSCHPTLNTCSAVCP